MAFLSKNDLLTYFRIHKIVIQQAFDMVLLGHKWLFCFKDGFLELCFALSRCKKTPTSSSRNFPTSKIGGPESPPNWIPLPFRWGVVCVVSRKFPSSYPSFLAFSSMVVISFPHKMGRDSRPPWVPSPANCTPPAMFSSPWPFSSDGQMCHFSLAKCQKFVPKEISWISKIGCSYLKISKFWTFPTTLPLPTYYGIWTF